MPIVASFIPGILWCIHVKTLTSASHRHNLGNFLGTAQRLPQHLKVTGKMLRSVLQYR